MKKALLVLVFLALGWQLKAECPPEVEDFTFTDCNGVAYNLFELLDGGQYTICTISMAAMAGMCFLWNC